jgi:hypothetical protein
MEPEKFCSDCGFPRPVAAFNRDRRQRDGVSFYCGEHSRERSRRSRLRRLGPPKTRRADSSSIPGGHKWCPDCGEIKPFDDFPASKSNSSGRHSYCKPCHNARGRETLARVGGARTYHLKRRYGISAEEADALLASQGGLCAICKAAPAKHVDHDHATGKVRAMLCFNCNGGLGQFKDDPAVLRAAAEYVRFHTLSQRVLAVCAEIGLGPVRAVRVGAPPVGSQRRPEQHGTSSRTTGRTSGSRRRKTAGEADA